MSQTVVDGQLGVTRDEGKGASTSGEWLDKRGVAKRQRDGGEP